MKMKFTAPMRSASETGALLAMRETMEKRFSKIVGSKNGAKLARLNELVDIPALSRVAPVAPSLKNKKESEKEDR